MVAQLFLVLHHTEVVIIAGAKQAIGKYLVVAASTGHDPDCSAARRELVFPNFLSLD